MSIVYDESSNQAIGAPDSLSGYSVARAIQANNGNRPLSTPPPPITLRMLNPRLWAMQDWDSIATMENLRKLNAKEAPDGTIFEWVGVGRPFKRNHIPRRANYGGNDPLQE